MTPGTRGRLAEAWGLFGAAFVFLKSAIQLGVRGIITISAGMTAQEWAACVLISALFIYGEGVRALQLKYMPYVLTRIAQLPTARASCQLLAPLYALSLIGATRRVLVKAWLGTAAIIAAVILVRRFAEPWRGIVDFAVALALTWGLTALMTSAWKIGRESGRSIQRGG